MQSLCATPLRVGRALRTRQLLTMRNMGRLVTRGVMTFAPNLDLLFHWANIMKHVQEEILRYDLTSHETNLL